MKLLRKTLDRLAPNFEAGGKLSRLKPVFEATDNFFFAGNAVTAGAPHLRDPLDVKRFMVMAIVALMPCVLTGVYFFGLRVLVLIAVSYAAGGLVEVVFAVVRKEEINEGFLVTGLIFPLTLPPALPLWMAAVGVILGVIIGKELFGGTGRNLFNPALVGRCILALGYPVAMASNWILPGRGFPGRLLQYVDASSEDAITIATPLVMAKTEQFTEWWDLFTGAVGGSVGETSVVAILAGGLFLLLTRVISWRTVTATFASFAVLGSLLHHTYPNHFGPMGWHLLAGGLMFGTFFMATDPVTSPMTTGGKWCYGILIGSTTVLIRNLTGWVEGVMFSILLGNIFAPALDEVASRFHLRRLQK